MQSTRSKTDIIHAVLDGLEGLGAFDVMPGWNQPDVQLFHPEPVCPGAGPLIRHFAVDGETQQRPTQNFVNWQRAFFSRALTIYMQSNHFTQWLMLHAHEQRCAPFSAIEMECISTMCRRIHDGDAKTYAAYEGHPQRRAAPGFGEEKIGPWEYRNTKKLALAQPTLLLGPALFQAAQITFLHDVMQEALARLGADKSDETMDKRKAIGYACCRVGLNFAQAKFHGVPAWVASAHFDRTNGHAENPLTAADCAKGWSAFLEGGGFETHETGREVICPYREYGTRAAATDICSAQPGPSPAYGVFCLGHAGLQRSPDIATHIHNALRYNDFFFFKDAVEMKGRLEALMHQLAPPVQEKVKPVVAPDALVPA